MPQFLEWMENKCGQGTVFKLNAALATPYDKTVFQAVTGESIQNLWKMYRSESLGKHQIDGDLEVVYADLESVLWPMPQISFTLDGKPDGNANTHLRDAITRAVLITFKHMYTPGTVPTTSVYQSCFSFTICQVLTQYPSVLRSSTSTANQLARGSYQSRGQAISSKCHWSRSRNSKEHWVTLLIIRMTHRLIIRMMAHQTEPKRTRPSQMISSTCWHYVWLIVIAHAVLLQVSVMIKILLPTRG